MSDNWTQVNENIVLPTDTTLPVKNRKPVEQARISIKPVTEENENNNNGKNPTSPVVSLSQDRYKRRPLSSPEGSKLDTTNAFSRRLCKSADDVLKQKPENTEVESLRPPEQRPLSCQSEPLLPTIISQTKTISATENRSVVILDSSEDEEKSIPPARKRAKRLMLDEDEVDFALSNGKRKSSVDDEFENIIATFCEVDD